MVETRTGKTTTPYTKAQEEQTVAVLKERKEKEAKKELIRQAKKLTLQQEQAAKMKKLEEEMERLRKEEEEKMKEVEEEEVEEEEVEEEEEKEEPLERRRTEERDNTLAHCCLSAPAFARLVKEQLEEQVVVAYEPEGHLRQVLEKLREANFKINAKKCEWAKTQVLYLGHVVDRDDIRPEDNKIAAIRDWPAPRTLTELRSFLGLANYYRKFVRNFSTIAAPLRRLLKKEAIWKWDKDCTAALKRLKPALIEYPVLKVVDPSRPFVVTTNASQYGIGAVLQQDDGNGYRPIEFMFARMPSKKMATSSYERELYALRQALDHWKHYLLGRHFKVYSDHETLRWLKTQAKMTPKLTRWAAELDQYNFELKPVKGKFRPILDFLAADEGRAVLLNVVDISKRKKTAVDLAKIWEQVIGKIRVQRINAICTDNEELNKQAAQIFRRGTNLRIARIPWVPCAAHCLNLLLKDIRGVDWVQEMAQGAKMMVKCSDVVRERSLILSTEMQFASEFMMLERLNDRRKLLEEMMEEGWKDIRWSGAKDKDKSEATYVTVWSTKWWQLLERALTVMVPVYELLRKIDCNGTAPHQLWNFVEGLMKRNTMKFLLSQCPEGSTWRCKENLDLWADLQAFHGEPTEEMKHKRAEEAKKKREEAQKKGEEPPNKEDEEKSFWTKFAKFDSGLSQLTASERWSTHGKSHKKLREIAVRVTAIWSTTTPCERNGSSVDLVHDKRRNTLGSGTVEKLVYVHWNKQLQKMIRLRKARKGRVPRMKGVDDSSSSYSSDDGEGLIWRGNGHKTQEQQQLEDLKEMQLLGDDVEGGYEERDEADGEDEEEGEEDEEGEDKENEEKVEFGLRPPRESDESNNSDDDNVDEDDTWRADAAHHDDDAEFLKMMRPAFTHVDSEDERARTEAQNLAHRDRPLVEQRMQQEAGKRVAVPAAGRRKTVSTAAVGALGEGEELGNTGKGLQEKDTAAMQQHAEYPNHWRISSSSGTCSSKRMGCGSQILRCGKKTIGSSNRKTGSNTKSDGSTT
ncbi:hypothetical protein CBR_g44592 [Chara braunii]|uniref:DUF659 domain-containing protein n=1 Tax=Chara braunii TaxID=69332 RepID=A0A388LXY5_CHABU|nr:hypothetical protein CBR_g44592 [Chara braunii]|eukprot:GBG87135.1 hypothetical protein CBR_g44592 [Chara braunii]